MLAFQNLHQIVFNLSQVTSIISSRVRVTSTTVQKKPEVDVTCSESFLNALKSFQQSDNANLFSYLPELKFGSKLEGIQWIYCTNVDFKFTAGKSIDKNDFYISLDKNTLKDLSPDALDFSKSCRSHEKKQEILAKVEALLEKPTWSKSYVSSTSFDENKGSYSCGSCNNFSKTSPVLSSLVGNIHSLTKSPDVLYVQKRGFKTRRAMELEKSERMDGSEGYSRFEDFLKLRGLKRLSINKYVDGFGKKVDVKDKSIENPTLSKMLENEATTPEEKLRLRVSFGEGYMEATNNLKKTSGQPFLMSVFKTVLIVFVGYFLLQLLNGRVKSNVFPFRLGQYVEVDPEEVEVTFDDVKGVEEVKEELQEIVEFLRNPSKFSRMGGKLPKGVLLVGHPGTGKTLLARAVAGEARVPFFHACGSEFDEVFVGEGARRVRNLFKSAKARAPCIIFIDEIDCVGSKRKSSMVHPYANQTINQLLSEMDGFSKNDGVIVLGATNRKKDLDSALLRPGRFDVEIVVPIPDLEGRKQILELFVGKIVSRNIDIEKLARATHGCTGADLEAMVNHAAIRAAADGAPFVTMEYLENAKDKVMIGPERKSAMNSEDSNLITAYHEGGHAVVAYFSEGVGVVDKVTIVPRGEALGHTSVVPETDESYVTKAKCLAKLDMLLGGRAAEELVFGANKITANASDDLEKATKIASSMVKQFGMSDKIGLRTFRTEEENMYGQAVTDQVDTEVKRLIQESYDRAKSILKKHAKEHKLLAEALMRYKTLNPEDVKAILGEKSKGSSSSSTLVE